MRFVANCCFINRCPGMFKIDGFRLIFGFNVTLTLSLALVYCLFSVVIIPKQNILKK